MTSPPFPDLAVSPDRCLKVLRMERYHPGPWRFHGPAGFSVVLGDSGSVIVSQADQDGEEWLHASIAWTDHMPSYDDLAVLHRAVFGPKRTAYQVFASEDQHVNIHEYALHLWGRADGRPVLPEFGKLGRI